MDDVELITAPRNVVYLPRQDRAEQRANPVPLELSPPTSTQVLYNSLQIVSDASGGAALLLLRIGEFEEFVESFGYACGEALDREIKEHLRGCLRSSDWIQPVGKGEYAIVIPQPADQSELEVVCERLVAAAGGSYEFGEVAPRVSAAIGVALYPTDSSRPEDVLRFANVALRNAVSEKSAGGAQSHCFFSQELLKRQRYKLWMEGELKRALAEDRFVLHYQPQYSLDGREIVGVEALVRMVTPTGSLVPPNDFIGVAEESGDIVQLGYWVIREACRQFAEWRELTGDSLKRVAVNVSPRQLQDAELPEVIRRALESAQIPASAVELEITEGCMLELLPVTGEVLRQLRELGVRIAIDDFGAGYSSFANLARLPLDTFKLDRSFLTNIAHDSRARQVVNAMIAMARELGYEIVAEGVETDQQYWFLQASGCHLVQGFGLGRPQHADVVCRLLEEAEERATGHLTA
ncbi:MAG: GGDEF domain-containing phosphodiesterase [Pseudomonadota bacterium]